MAPDKAPQIELLSHESRRQALRGGLAALFSRVPKVALNGHNGNGAIHKPPQINLLAHEPRRKVLTGGLATLLRKHPVVLADLRDRASSDSRHIPGFKLLAYESRRQAIRSGFKSLFLKTPPPDQELIVGRQEVGKDSPKFTAFLTSCLMHFSIVFFLLEVPFFFLLPRPSQTIKLPQIVYEFHEIELPKDLPSVKPPGPGGEPGRGTHPEKAPAKGSSAFHHSATVISNPPNPDNNFQTIIQPHVNPAQKLDIKLKLRLPNVVLGGSLPVPGPPAIPPPPPMKLTAPPALKSLTIPKTTVVSVKPPDLTIPAADMPNMPAIPVPPPPLPPLAQRKDLPKNLDLTSVATQAMEATSNGSVTSLLSLSLTPGPPTDQLKIPAGNRYGAFTISPEGNHAGTPNGNSGGSTTGGTGGPGSGGDASTGVGSGNVGGGGGGSGVVNGLGASTSGNPGTAGATGDAAALSAAAVAKLIYPILRVPLKNRFAMVVTAGPQGGGGLHVFGVLKGGKVYTIFLPMPQRSWILQYSMMNDPNAQQKPQHSGVTLQVDFGVVPPAVEQRFDFHRPNLTAEQKQKMIILHGYIGADGSVERVTIYRGVESLADRAARAAFEKWKFQPAVRSGKPVPIEILLGIPLS
ncbi:MAG TPA: energy transducer TonB [Terriglobia bacterium]|nr:energy transducer TonB [Terriglobia bacterium]